MRRCFARELVVVILWGLVLVAPIGCKGPDADEPKPAEAEPSDTSAKPSGPTETVYAFLEGARRGDDQAVKAMFTETARKELAQAGLNIAPKASDTARFDLGEVRISPTDENIAYVATRLTEVDIHNNQSHSEEVIWALRDTPEGWRIAGMLRTVFEGEPPWTFNFEDHRDLLRQGENVRAEMARRARAAQPPATTARTPDVAPQR